MSLRDALAKVLSAPAPVDLWSLRAELLEAGVPAGARVWRVVDEFHDFLDRIATSTSSRQYSELASRLDIGAVSGVVLEQLLEGESGGDLPRRALAGLLSEGLMFLATRQHVKAWQGELRAVHRRAAWYVYEELWSWSRRENPDLPAAERRRLVDRLLEPIHAGSLAESEKAILLGLLFQLLLASYLGQELPRS